MGKLEAKKVYQHYVVDGLSDRQIAELYGVDRSAVTQLRKRHGIQPRKSVSEEGHDFVKEQISKRYSFLDRRESSLITRTNFLVERVARVQVFTSALRDDDSWTFFIPVRKAGDIAKDNRFFEKQSNGDYAKILSKSCDVVILCALDARNKLFIIPSRLISTSVRAIKIPVEVGKYKRFLDRWDFLDKVIKDKKGEL